MCNFKEKNNNVTMENPDRDYINQVIKVNITSQLSDTPQYDAQRKAYHLSASSPITYKLMDHEKALHRPKSLDSNAVKHSFSKLSSHKRYGEMRRVRDCRRSKLCDS